MFSTLETKCEKCTIECTQNEKVSKHRCHVKLGPMKLGLQSPNLPIKNDS